MRGNQDLHGMWALCGRPCGREAGRAWAAGGDRPGQVPAARAVAASALRCDRPWQLREDFLCFLKDAPAFLRQIAHMIVGAAIGRRQRTIVVAVNGSRILRLQWGIRCADSGVRCHRFPVRAAGGLFGARGFAVTLFATRLVRLTRVAGRIAIFARRDS